jgi:hypothetical protein
VIAANEPAVVSLEFPSRTVRRDHVYADLLEVIIEPIAVKPRSPIRRSGLASIVWKSKLSCVRNLAQDLAFAPLLKPTMYRLVVRGSNSLNRSAYAVRLACAAPVSVPD